MPFCAHRLDTGLRVALWPRAGAGTVSVSAWVEVGSADDPRGLGGLAHFLEHMLFKGTAERGVGEIASDLEAVGGDINAWTTFDNIVVQLRVPPTELELGIDVAGDMLSSPRLDAAEVELERGVVLDELGRAAADPQRALGRGLFQTVFRRHPYRAPILGDTRSIDRIGKSDLEAFAGRYLGAENVIVAVAGDFEPDAASALIERSFSRLPRTAARRRQPSLPVQESPRERVIYGPVIEGQLILAFPSPPLASRDHLLLDMISIALGQGGSSVLATRLETDAGLATSSGAYVHGFNRAGLFVATASAAAEKVLDCTEALAAHVFSAATAPLSDESLEMVKNAIATDSVYGRETVGGLAAAMGSSWAHGGDPNGDRQRLAWAREVTRDDLRDVALRTLRPERATLAAMVPDEGARHSPGTFARLIESVGHAVRSTPGPAAAAKAGKKSNRATPATRRVALSNGAVIIVHRDETVPLVAAQATWRGGLLFESAATSGIGALLAATITRGCGARSDDEVARFLDTKAMILSGYSGRNSFGVRAEWISSAVDDGLDLLLDCLETPRFAAPVVERERRRLREDAEARTQSASHLAHKMFAEALYGSHPYALDPLGDEAPLDAIAGVADAAVREHFRGHYPPSAVTLAIVGDVDPDAVVEKITARLGANAAGGARSSPSAARATPSADRQRFAYVERSRAHLVVGFPGVALADPDRAALEVLAAVLGGQGGRLFTNLREKRGLVYRVTAHSIEGADPGAFAVVTTSLPSKAADALAAIRFEIDRLTTELVSNDELRRATRFLKGTAIHSLERRGNLAAALAYAEAQGLGYESVWSTRAALDTISADDLRRVARRFLRWDLAVTSTVLPPAATPGVVQRARGVRRKLPAAAARKRRK